MENIFKLLKQLGSDWRVEICGGDEQYTPYNAETEEEFTLTSLLQVEEKLKELIKNLGDSVFEITEKNFLDWYFNTGCDDEKKEIKMDLALSIIDQLNKTGIASISAQELFDNSTHEMIPVKYISGFSGGR